MDRMEKPVLVEGPAGVGKTELARALASALGRELIRLQCYEGLDEAKALYEWEYAKQLLYTQLLKDKIGEMMTGAATLNEAADRLANAAATSWKAGTAPAPGPGVPGAVVRPPEAPAGPPLGEPDLFSDLEPVAADQIIALNLRKSVDRRRVVGHG